MSKGVGRVTDVFVGVCMCCPNAPIPMTGSITTGSTDITSDGLGAARVGDLVVGLCGHTGVISSGSDNVLANGLGVATVDSTVTGCLVGKITTGSETVITG